MTMRTAEVGKKKPAGESTGKTTVKLKVDLHRKARTVAAYRNMNLDDFLDELLRPLVGEAYAEMAREIREGPTEDE